MNILYGKDIVDSISIEINTMLEKLQKINKIPRLIILRVGKREDDITYEHSIKKKLDSFGLPYIAKEYDEDVSVDTMKQEILKYNEDHTISSIMIFRPLPKHLMNAEITELIDPKKDIDCATLYNQGRLFDREDCLYYPCTPKAVMETLRYNKIDLKSKKVVIAGASQVVGKPLTMMFLKEKATVTTCNSNTVDLNLITKNADIVVAAIGKAKYLTKEYFSKNQIVIDVGINFDENGKMCGDVDFENLDMENITITPVPRGIGSITTTILVKQLVEKEYKTSNII